MGTPLLQEPPEEIRRQVKSLLQTRGIRGAARALAMSREGALVLAAGLKCRPASITHARARLAELEAERP